MTYSRVKGDGKRVVRARRINSRDEFKAVFNPGIGCALGSNRNASKHLAGDVRNERSIEVARVRPLDPKGSGVGLLLDIHSPVAVIVETNGALGVASGNIDRRLQGFREGRAQILQAEDGTIDRVPAFERGRVRVAGLEGSVSNQFGV